MKYEICDINKENMTVCWAIDAGKTFIHFTNDLGELLALRKVVDEVIKNLEEAQTEEDEKHELELSLRAKRVKEIKRKNRK